MNAEEMQTIIKMIEKNETTFVQTEKPPAGLTQDEKYALKKFLMNKPQSDGQPVRMIRIRCDRQQDQWALYDERGKKALSHFTCGVLKDATLSSKEIPAQGCAGADYIGMASGDMISSNTPVTVPNNQVFRLIFDRYAGCFKDAHTLEEITAVDYLILKEGCHAEYIKAPEGNV